MSNTTNNDDQPIGELSLVDDFLPPPSQLIPREETVEVTLSLNKKTIAFYQKQAIEKGISYHILIRNLIDDYAQQSN
jgi:hypothetical protein